MVAILLQVRVHSKSELLWGQGQIWGSLTKIQMNREVIAWMRAAKLVMQRLKSTPKAQRPPGFWNVNPDL